MLHVLQCHSLDWWLPPRIWHVVGRQKGCEVIGCRLCLHSIFSIVFRYHFHVVSSGGLEQCVHPHKGIKRSVSTALMILLFLIQSLFVIFTAFLKHLNSSSYSSTSVPFFLIPLGVEGETMHLKHLSSPVVIVSFVVSGQCPCLEDKCTKLLKFRIINSWKTLEAIKIEWKI